MLTVFEITLLINIMTERESPNVKNVFNFFQLPLRLRLLDIKIY